MPTPAEALLALSPLNTGTPAEHLLAIELSQGVDPIGLQPPIRGVVAAPDLIAGRVVSPQELKGTVVAPQRLTGRVVSVKLYGEVDQTTVSGSVGCKSG